MERSWKASKYFKDDFYLIGDWCFDKVSKFPHTKYISADTETKLYYNDKLLSEEEAYNLYKNNGQSWVKENIEVRAYAFTLADKNNFALFKNIEDFLTACAMLNVSKVFWYNAKFDFAIFDYYFLTNDWKSTEERIANSKHYKKLGTNTYQSLDGDFGQRYQMRIWKEYINRKSMKKVHSFKMLDICNIFSGGLAKNLEDWKIKENKEDIRKLKMDYVSADYETDMEYIYNDTKGLYLLAEKIENTIKEISGFSLFNGDYLTAGGLAKKSLLKFMFGESNKENIELFKHCFPITMYEDKEFRKNHLYLGGKALVNPNKIAIVQRNIYKYDVNSMYPDKMRNMAYPFGVPNKIYNIKDCKEDKLYIVKLKSIVGIVKENKIPMWQDTLSGKYTEIIREYKDYYIWLEELRELENWYQLDYKVEYLLEYEKKYPIGVQNYVDTYYKIKCTSKGAVKNGAKLFLNSAYGKLAQRIERVLCHYELSDKGYVHLVKTEPEADEKSMLSVVVGSRITALARVNLMQYIRKICREKVKDYFVYCDTDSVHALVPFNDTDDKALGKMKFEGKYNYGLYLAPKTYLLYDNVHYEVHCKGVNTNVVANELSKCKDFSEAITVFRPNKLFKCLCGLNTKGGKALIYVDKVIVNDEYMVIKDPDNDLEVI